MVDAAIVYRVAYRPDPFTWTPWRYAADGHFDGRFDDSDGQFRTVYVGDSLLGCLLEVLAKFRPDLTLAAAMADTVVEDAGEIAHPTAPAGRVPRSWLEPRCAGMALLHGTVADVRTPGTVAEIRHHLGPIAVEFGLADVDAAVLKLTAPREFTQRVAAWLYQRPEDLAGIRFGSRHADGFTLWALFERPEDDETPHALTEPREVPLDADAAAPLHAFSVFGLSWSDTP